LVLTDLALIDLALIDLTLIDLALIDLALIDLALDLPHAGSFPGTQTNFPTRLITPNINS
jgi:hypothetical protein